MSSKVKMLVADDSQTSRLILYEEFHSTFEVLNAAGGDECLDMLKKNPDIAIVLLDILMPGTDGIKVLKAMAMDDKMCFIPVIAITGSDSTDDYIEVLDLGAYDVMQKPLNLRLLRHKVNNIVTRNARAVDEKNIELIRKLAKNSDIDEKTGIYNRRTFCKKVKEILLQNTQKQYVITRFDIDGFKVLNDVYGVLECDRLLKTIGDSISHRYNKPSKVIYGRWEADHFVMFMEMDDFHRLHVVEHVGDFIEGFFDFELTFRMGVYVIDDPSLDIALMCDRALLALKSVKNNFQRRIAFYDENMRTELLEKQQVINEMKSALEGGQFVLYFQPQYNYAGKSLHGAEALVRWKHPERGIIPPVKFVPVFEENGFITHLDQFVWEEACRCQRKWLDAGLEIVPVSVNVSRTDICSLRLSDYFKRLVEKYNLPTTAIRIEITESAYIDNPAQLISAVDRLRDAGFAVEMDDFGSGYSSLNTLKDVSVDLLKLDMRFIDDHGQNSKGGSILSSVVRMSNWLRLPVLAEGVETKQQAEYLKSIGCIYMQGYYFAKPMPMEEFENLLKNDKKEMVCVNSYLEDVSDSMEFLNASTQKTLLFNSFVGGAAIIEFDGVNVEAVRINDKFFEVIDSTREEYMQKCNHLLDGFDEINSQKFCKALEKAISTKQEVGVELCSSIIHKGQDVWTRARIRLLVTNVDKYLFYLTIENISQRMNLLVNNLRLTDQLTTIINSVPGGIADFELSKNDECKILFFNNRLAQLFGYTREEYINQFVDNFIAGVYPDDIQELLSAKNNLFDGFTNSFSLRCRHICSNGTWKWIQIDGGKTRRQGNSIFATAIITDIDDTIIVEQKAMFNSREVARRQKMIDAIYENSPYGIVQLTTTVTGYEFNSCNDNAWKFLGFENKEQFKHEMVRNKYKMEARTNRKKEIHESLLKVVSGTDGAKCEFDVLASCFNGNEILLHNIVQKVVFNNEVEYIQHIYIPIESENMDFSDYVRV